MQKQSKKTKENLRDEKGITLVALVVMVIILLQNVTNLTIKKQINIYTELIKIGKIIQNNLYIKNPNNKCVNFDLHIIMSVHINCIMRINIKMVDK